MNIWALFFTTVLGWQYHPGIKQRLTIRECAAIADEMFAEYLARDH